MIKNKFEIARNTKMSDEEFQILTLIYPVFLVATADGTFDEVEKKLISEILFNFLNPIYGDKITDLQYESLIENFLEDFDFLIQNKKEFHTHFLSMLSDFDSNVRKSISNLLIEIADASDGIQENELIAINSLNEILLEN
jgi:uncharacterized tellurite resistance protein B-like protein